MKLRPACLRYPASTAALMAAIFASFAGQSAQAATGTWTSTADGNWSTATNWSGNVIADGAGSQANFNLAGLTGTNTTTTTLDGNRTIGNLSRGSGGSTGVQQSWTITHATNVLTLDNGASNVFISSGLNGNYLLMVDTDIALNSNLVLTGNGNNNAKITLGATVGGHTITGSKNITFNNTNSGGAGALIINSNINTTGGIFNTSSQGSNFLAINGNIGSGVTGVTQSGSRTLTLSGNNTYTSATTVSGGTLTAGVASAAGVSGAFGLNSAVTMGNAGGTLNLNNFNTQIGSITGGGAVGGVTLGTATLTTGGDNTSPAAYAGVISGTGGLTKIGTGTQILSGTNTYTGTTTINAGTLRASGGSAIADTGAVALADVASATFNLTSSETIGNLSGGGTTGGTVTLGANTLTTGSATSTSFGGVISGTDGALTKSGAGTLTLTGTNTYTGPTTISAGTLAMVTNRIASSSNIFIGNGATLNTSGGEWTMAGGQSITGTGATGNIVATTNAGITMNGNNTISNNAGGTLALYRLNVTGANNTITAGTITAGGAGAGQRGLDLGRSGAGTLTITGGSLITNGSAALGDILGENGSGNSLIINGGNYTANSAGGLNIGFGQASGTLTLTSGNATITTIALAPVNAGNARVNLDGGTLTLGTLTVGGGTGAKSFTFNGGTLVASGALSMSGLNSVNVANGGANINTNGNTVTISNALLNSGTGGLTKTGLGNLTLTGTSNYVGATQVNAGKLLIGTSGSLGASSAVTVGGTTATPGSAPTLGGGGTIGGVAVISSAGAGAVGTHAPGITGTNGGVGTQTFSASLTYQAGSIFEWDLKTAATGVAGTQFDAVTVDSATGSLAVNNNATTGSIFKVVLGEAFVGGDTFWSNPTQRTWDVFAATNSATLGASTNIFSRFQLFDTSSATVPVDFSSFGSFGFTNSGSTGTLTWTAVPEPTSALAGLLITAGLLRRRRQEAK